MYCNNIVYMEVSRWWRRCIRASKKTSLVGCHWHWHQFFKRRQVL